MWPMLPKELFSSLNVNNGVDMKCLFRNKKEMSLRDIQMVSLDIMVVIDEFCLRNNINYSLGYGALIGAVRHHGCIPWDDDIDIIITRPEYQKLLKLFNEDEKVRLGGVKLYAPELGNCFFPIARICDLKRTKVHKYYQWTDDETGVWIDVFVLDAFSEEYRKKMQVINSSCLKSCATNVHLSSEISFIKNVKFLRRRFLNYRFKDRNQYIDNYLKEIKELSCENSQKLGCFASPYKTDIHRKELFNKYIRVSFEDCKFCIIASYDEYLRNIYGDYMVLPPIEKRVRGHSLNTYWWIR